MRILLWDIDGTLISTGGAGIRSLGSVVNASESATRALGRMRLDGMTDRKIARILCAAMAHREHPEVELESLMPAVTQEQIDSLLARYLEVLATSIGHSEKFRIMPGVVDVLDALGPDRAVHALGTGNLIDGARIKLQHAKLWDRFAFGGFGSDAEERADVIRAAWPKAEAHLGRKCSASEFVVIGDTPKDVAAAHACGFACVGVATGRHTIHELAESGADLVLESLAQPGVTEHLLSVQRR
jgi:phosphoglycolate phosphatase-like HAD superfamily hydrolase